MQAVVPMDHRYLAEHDGSELAAGRGSGKDKPLEIGKIRFGKNKIPFMNMTYAPIERRLDMAVWRALFASSARQARQFCIHGKVKVNGQKVWRQSHCAFKKLTYY
jgi:ribosomal protein S4